MVIESVFSPQQVSSIAYEAVELRHNNRDGEIKTGMSVLDRDLLPMRPGELVIVCGYTSNYKSGLMNYIARNNAQALQNDDFLTDYKKAVITFTWEQR
jgi:hypothetical protein